jgi:hypothetical protein
MMPNNSAQVDNLSSVVPCLANRILRLLLTDQQLEVRIYPKMHITAIWQEQKKL